MEAKTLFQKAAKQANVCAGHVNDNQLSNPTPCTEWDLKTLLNHVVYELSWVPDLLAGKTVAEVGSVYDGDLLRGDWLGAWHRALTAAEEAVGSANLSSVVHLSYGDVPAEDYIREIGADVAVHGWDVSQSEMCNLIMAEDLARAIYDYYYPRRAELNEGNLFGPALETSPNDTIQTRMLALLGRKANTI